MENTQLAESKGNQNQEKLSQSNGKKKIVTSVNVQHLLECPMIELHCKWLDIFSNLNYAVTKVTNY